MPRWRNVSFTYENEQKSDPEKKERDDDDESGEFLNIFQVL